MRIAVIGGGSWGTALANLFSEKGYSVALLVRTQENAHMIHTLRENPRYLPGLSLSPSLLVTASPEEALGKSEICLLAVPCQHMRSSLLSLRAYIPPDAIPVCVSKGIETTTHQRMQEVITEVLPSQAEQYAILSGPSFAREVVEKKPTAVVLGCSHSSTSDYLRNALSTSFFRVYSSPDVIGVELGGAMKNVIAIAAGMADGLSLGDNARAGIITRGLAEMSRLGGALGAQQKTFMGLSGLGDLVLTCTGDLSRNRQVGIRLASGESIEHITQSMHMVAEGISTTLAAKTIGEHLGIDMPVTKAVFQAIHEQTSLDAMVHALMTRALREE